MMQGLMIPVGIRHLKSIAVTEALTVPAVSSVFTGFQDMPPVFAAAFLIGFIEWTCIEALRERLQAGSKRSARTSTSVMLRPPRWA